ncbi:MAG: hypothetical protein Q7K71_05845 [Candidatus Omnitrophota bacterium]|nr:hypothetical protein [Candidatus Omnitrophota bacterium]
MIKRIQTLVVLVCFACNLGLPSVSFAASNTFLDLPVPGTMLSTSQAFTPALIKGVQINPQNPLEFNFIVDTGDSRISGEQLKTESAKMVKYFLASLTVPDKELWVNLSPYEKNRIIPESFGLTEMGRDLLAQDYILKQLTASLVYPEKELGKTFWEKAYKLAQEKMGTTNIPVNTFNKVWIIPDNATVYEHNGSAFVVNSHLKVMLEEDYLALQNNLNNKKFGTAGMETKDTQAINSVASQAVREVLIPAIETEVNTGKNFSNLRQVYNSMILAIWYKQNLKETLLNQVYSNQNKTKGIDVQDKASKEKIYSQYLEAFKKGVYNYIKEDRDPATNTTIPRKYFSGGAVAPSHVEVKTGLAMLGNDERAALPGSNAQVVTVDLVENATRADVAMTVAEKRRLDKVINEFPGLVVVETASELTHLGLRGAYKQVMDILAEQITGQQKQAKIIDLFLELARSAKHTKINEILGWLQTTDISAQLESTDKKTLGRFNRAIKDASDGIAKQIFVRVAKELGIIMLVRVSEGFGRDGVAESLKVNEVVAPDELEGEASAIIEAIKSVDGKYYHSEKMGKAYGIVNAIIDVVEGTNMFVTNSDGKTLTTVEDGESGATSIIAVGDGVADLGNAPDGYVGQFVTNLGDDASKFRKLTVDIHGVPHSLSDPEVYAENPELIIEYLKFLAKVRGQELTDLQEEIVVMDRKRETKFLNVLRGLQQQVPGLKITTIKDGTVAHGLKAAMTSEMYKAATGRDYGIHKTVITVAGSAEGFLVLAIAGGLKSKGTVGGLRVYSGQMNNDEAGVEVNDQSQRYNFRVVPHTDPEQNVDEPADIMEARESYGDAEAILKGNKLFHEGDVQGNVYGAFSFISTNGVFAQEGVDWAKPSVVRNLIIDTKPKRAPVVRIVTRDLNAERADRAMVVSQEAQSVAELLSNIVEVIKVTAEGIQVLNEHKLRAETVDYLAQEAALSENEDVRLTAQRILRESANALGIKAASIDAFYKARNKPDGWTKLTTPAYNVRTGPAYVSMRQIIRANMEDKVGPFVLELATSERRYTAQFYHEYTAMGYAAAIKEGYRGPLFFQLDHLQIPAKDYAKDPEGSIKKAKTLMHEAVAAGIYNIDLDPSTLWNDVILEEVLSLEREITNEFIQTRRATDIEFNGQIMAAGDIKETHTQESTALRDIRRALVNMLEVGRPDMIADYYERILAKKAELIAQGVFKGHEGLEQGVLTQEDVRYLRQYPVSADKIATLKEKYIQALAVPLQVTMDLIRFIRHELEPEYNLDFPISIGVEERHTDNPLHKDFPSTVLGSLTLMHQVAEQSQKENLVLPSKEALQTGTQHGLGGEPYWGSYIQHEAAAPEIGVGVFVQHGTSTLKESEFPNMPVVGTGEAHLATKYQQLALGIAVENAPELLKAMQAYLEGLVHPEWAEADMDAVTAAKIKQQGLWKSEKRKSDYEAKFRDIWERVFAKLRELGWSDEKIMIGLLYDNIDGSLKFTDAKGKEKKVRGALKDLTKELSAPFKRELWTLEQDAQGQIAQAVYEEVKRTSRDLNVGNTQAVLAKAIPFEGYNEPKSKRPEALEKAVADAAMTAKAPRVDGAIGKQLERYAKLQLSTILSKQLAANLISPDPEAMELDIFTVGDLMRYTRESLLGINYEWAGKVYPFQEKELQEIERALGRLGLRLPKNSDVFLKSLTAIGISRDIADKLATISYREAYSMGDVGIGDIHVTADLTRLTKDEFQRKTRSPAATVVKIEAALRAYGYGFAQPQPDAAQLSNVDRAVVVEKDPYGGINLDPAMLNLQIKRDGKGIPLPINQQPIGNMKIDGFMPVIIKVTPISNLPLLLGLTDKEPALALSH